MEVPSYHYVCPRVAKCCVSCILEIQVFIVSLLCADHSSGLKTWSRSFAGGLPGQPEVHVRGVFPRGGSLQLALQFLGVGPSCNVPTGKEFTDCQ